MLIPNGKRRRKEEEEEQRREEEEEEMYLSDKHRPACDETKQHALIQTKKLVTLLHPESTFV